MTKLKLPVDATGKEIPLDTRVLYRTKDGDCKKVELFFWTYCPASGKWCVTDTSLKTYSDAGEFTLNPPDSWEKLLEDLDFGASECNQICEYMSRVITNSECLSKSCTECENEALANIASRIRALRGDAE